jgi:hypothetical protein
VPRVVDYEIVKQTMAQRGFVTLYHNSGAFGFASATEVWNAGWVEAEDSTIRETARALAQVVPSMTEKFANTLEQLPGDVWLMPKSHWHYELHFSNRELLESLLPVDAELLRDRNDGSAISFSADERSALVDVVRRLLQGLRGSDFILAFIDARTLCTIHHHKQLWWQTANALVHPILIG